MQDYEHEEQMEADNYTKMVNDMGKEIEAHRKMMAHKQAQKAEATEHSAEQQGIADDNESAIMDTDKALFAVHKDCDFLLNNFQTRQESFAVEIKAAEDAVSTL